MGKCRSSWLKWFHILHEAEYLLRQGMSTQADKPSARAHQLEVLQSITELMDTRGLNGAQDFFQTLVPPPRRTRDRGPPAVPADGLHAATVEDGALREAAFSSELSALSFFVADAARVPIVCCEESFILPAPNFLTRASCRFACKTALRTRRLGSRMQSVVNRLRPTRRF
jgi:hypothetical protein